MGDRGPAGKSVNELKLHGNFRNDRHGHREGQPQATGVPKKPRGLGKYAAKLWDEIVPQLIERRVVGEIDATIIRTTCELYGLYRSALTVAESDLSDKDARIAVTSYFAAFDKAAVKLGLSPADRRRIQVQPNEDDNPSPLQKFARRRT